MRFLILGILLLLTSGHAWSQEYSGGGSLSQWQLTFDVIRSKLNGLMDHNNQLASEYKTLDDSKLRINQSINDLNTKNEEMRQLLKSRHGKTDQEIRGEGLQSQLTFNKTKLAALESKAIDLKTQVAGVQKTIELKKVKIQDLELNQNMPKSTVVSSSGDVELDDLRNNLEEEKQKEVRLEDKLSSMANAAKHPEINLLNQKLEFLIKEKQEILSGKKTLSAASSPGSVNYKGHFSSLEQKAELEKKIRQFENKINSLKGTQALAATWPSIKKKMIHNIVQVDGRNVRLREQINNLREDVDLLREKIAGLEKRLGGNNGQSKHARK